jgi:hypothetical protein
MKFPKLWRRSTTPAESTPEPVTAISLYEPTLDERIAAARIVTNRYRRELYRLERLKAKEQTK